MYSIYVENPELIHNQLRLCLSISSKIYHFGSTRIKCAWSEPLVQCSVLLYLLGSTANGTFRATKVLLKKLKF